jgi:hypothetical protein
VSDSCHSWSARSASVEAVEVEGEGGRWGGEVVMMMVRARGGGRD